MPQRTSLWKKLNATTLFIGVGCVFSGAAAAALHGNFELLPFTLCLVFVILAQLSGNYYQRYYDLKNHLGGYIDIQISAALQQPEERLPVLKAAASGMAFLALMVGFAIVGMSGWKMLVAGIFIIVVSWLTCGGVKPLMRSPLGPFCAFVLFGPTCVILTCMFQAQREHGPDDLWYDLSPALFMAVSMGCLAANAALAYSYASVYSNLRNSRMSFTTEFGRRGTRIAFLISSLIAFGFFVWRNLYFDLHLYGLEWLAPSVGLVLSIYIWYRMRSLPRFKAMELTKQANFTVFITGLISLVVNLSTGVPDDSQRMFFAFL